MDDTCCQVTFALDETKLSSSILSAKYLDYGKNKLFKSMSLHHVQIQVSMLLMLRCFGFIPFQQLIEKFLLTSMFNFLLPSAKCCRFVYHHIITLFLKTTKLLSNHLNVWLLASKNNFQKRLVDEFCQRQKADFSSGGGSNCLFINQSQ